MRLIHILGLALLVLAGCKSAETPTPIELEVSSSPSLPIPNMLRNGGFEEGLPPWGTRTKEGVALSKEKAHGGANSIRVVVEKRSEGKSLYCTGGALTRPLKAGGTYILDGWVNASPEVDNCGGTYYGAGLSMSVFDAKWERSDRCRAYTHGKNQWVHLVSGPLTIPDWKVSAEVSASISYAHGTAYFDDIRLAEAYAELSVHARSQGLAQVLVEDEAGRLVFDSGRLPDKTDSFAASVRVLSPHRYLVHALNRSGEVKTVRYP